MKETLSPTQSFFDFDFSEFIDKNFDMSNDILNSPNTKSVSPSSSNASTALDDFISVTSMDKSSSLCNYTLDNPSLYVSTSLWSSIEELAHRTDCANKAPMSLSCIDTFIENPQSDLVDLVQQSTVENTLFQHLVLDSMMNQKPLTQPYMFQQQLVQQRQLNEAVMQQNYQHEQQQQQQQQQLLKALTKHQSMAQPPALVQNSVPKRRKTAANILQHPLSNSKNSVKADISRYSTSSNPQYTHSDQVNAQLLKELIRQAGRNANHPIGPFNAMDANQTNDRCLDFSLPQQNKGLYAPIVNGNYPSMSYHSVPPPPLPPSSSTSSLLMNKQSPAPFPMQASTKKQRQQKSMHHPYQRSKPSGKPSMYSSDLSQAQLLEIQAISRAQQDFIRAREQQEAEKELILKQQKKPKLP